MKAVFNVCCSARTNLSLATLSTTSPARRQVLTLLNETGVDYEVVNVLDETYNPGLREAIKQYSQWPTIPQVHTTAHGVQGFRV
jgi:glutaredoxin-related protein